MAFKLTKKDRLIALKVVSGILGNLAAGWFGIILITPGFSSFGTSAEVLLLIRSLVLGILFAYLSFRFEKEI